MGHVPPQSVPDPCIVSCIFRKCLLGAPQILTKIQKGKVDKVFIKNSFQSIIPINITYEWISLAVTKICTKSQNYNFAIAVIFYPVIISL